MRSLLALILVLILSVPAFAGNQPAPASAPATQSSSEDLTLEKAINKDTKEHTRQLYNRFLEKVYQWMDKGGNFVEKGVEKGTEFVSQQAPLVCNEIVLWGRIYYGFWSVVGALILMQGIIFIRRSILDKETPYFIDYHDSIFSWRLTRLLLGIGFSLGGGLLTIVNVSTFLMALSAPRLYILQQIMRLMHKA